MRIYNYAIVKKAYIISSFYGNHDIHSQYYILSKDRTFFLIWIFTSTWTAKMRIPIWPYHALLQCFQDSVNYDEGYARHDMHPGRYQRTYDDYDDGGFNRQRFLQKISESDHRAGHQHFIWDISFLFSNYTVSSRNFKLSEINSFAF